MSRHKCVEDWIVEDTDTCLVVGKMVVSGLIVVVEEHSSATGDDTFGRGGDSETVNLVSWAVEGLDSQIGTDVPNSEHAGDIC
jgi:hypothetical protein